MQAALGIAYAENGEMERAITTLKNLVASQPDSADAHFNLGLLYARDGQSKDEEAAVPEFREALRLDAGMDAARIALGRVLISLHTSIPTLLPFFWSIPIANRRMLKASMPWRWHTRG